MAIAVYENGSLTRSRTAATDTVGSSFRRNISVGGGSGNGYTIAIPFRDGAGVNAQNEADLIPDWAAILVAIGAAVAAAGFVAAWFTEGGFSTLVLTVGLLLVAGGMAGAEDVVGGQE